MPRFNLATHSIGLSATIVEKKQYYFVDEAGDPVLFNQRKQIVVGKEGCSTYFILGLLQVPDPTTLGHELLDLRRQLLADPYFKNVQSMQPVRRKTAIAFHAKDDIPEIRREVFNLIMKHDVRFFAVVRDKRRIVQIVREHNLKQPQYRYQHNHLYDKCVSRLFKDRLHKEDAYRIVFAKRGRSDRTEALLNSLETARQKFRQSWGVSATAPIEVVPSVSASDQHRLVARRRKAVHIVRRPQGVASARRGFIESQDSVLSHNQGDRGASGRPQRDPQLVHRLADSIPIAPGMGRTYQQVGPRTLPRFVPAGGQS